MALVYPVDYLDQAWVALLRSPTMDGMNDASIELLAVAGYNTMDRVGLMMDSVHVDQIFTQLRKDAATHVAVIPTGMVAPLAIPAVAAPPVGMLTRAAAAAAVATATVNAAAALLAAVQPVGQAQVIPDRASPTFSNVTQLRFKVLVNWYHQMGRMGMIAYSQSFTTDVCEAAWDRWRSEMDRKANPMVTAHKPANLTRLVNFNKWKLDFHTYVDSIFGMAKIPLTYVYRKVAEESAADLAADAYPTMVLRLAARTRLSGAHFDQDNDALSRLLAPFVQGDNILPHVKSYLDVHDGRGAMLALLNASLGSLPLDVRHQNAANELRALKFVGHHKSYPFDSYVTSFIGLCNELEACNHGKGEDDKIVEFQNGITDRSMESIKQLVLFNPALKADFATLVSTFQQAHAQHLATLKGGTAQIAQVNSGKRKRGGNANGKGNNEKKGGNSKPKFGVGPAWTEKLTARKYAPSEWVRLTRPQQLQVIELKKKNGSGSSGADSATPARDVSAMTTQTTTNIAQPETKEPRLGTSKQRRDALRKEAHLVKRARLNVVPDVLPVAAPVLPPDDDESQGNVQEAPVASLALPIPRKATARPDLVPLVTTEETLPDGWDPAGIDERTGYSYPARPKTYLPDGTICPPNTCWRNIPEVLPAHLFFVGTKYVLRRSPTRGNIYVHRRDGTLWEKPNRNDPKYIEALRRKANAISFASDDEDDDNTPAKAAVAAVATSATEACEPVQLFGRHSAISHAPKGCSEQLE